jgi:hypothetical protein
VKFWFRDHLEGNICIQNVLCIGRSMRKWRYSSSRSKLRLEREMNARIHAPAKEPRIFIKLESSWVLEPVWTFGEEESLSPSRNPTTFSPSLVVLKSNLCKLECWCMAWIIVAETDVLWRRL